MVVGPPSHHVARKQKAEGNFSGLNGHHLLDHCYEGDRQKRNQA